MDHTKDEYMQDQKAQAITRVFKPTNDSSIIFSFIWYKAQH